MTPDNSVLVDYTLVPVEDSQGLYCKGRWADPDIKDAAAKLKALIDDPALRERLGAQAARDVAASLDPSLIGRTALGWLDSGRKD
jgi:hypothetical protein